jgi:hypothetical protein
MTAMPFPRSFSLLTPLLWVAAMFLLLLAGRSMLQNRSSRKERASETIEWGRPRPSLIQRWRIEIGRIRFRLPRFLQRRMPEIAPKPAPSVPANAPADPLRKPTQPMLGLFGSTVNGSTIGPPETKPKEAFAWEKTKEIE